MSPSPTRPHPFAVGPVKARIVRGPRADGRWYWRAGIYRDGTERTVWTGWALPEEAVRLLAAKVAEDRLDVPEVEDKAETIGDLMEYFIGRQELRADLSPETLTAQRNASKRLKRGMGPARIDRLDLAALERFRDVRLRAGSAPGTIALDFQVLRAAWAYGREVGLIPDQVLPRVRLLAPSRAPKRTPSPAEISRVLPHLIGIYKLAVLLLASTGCRRGEVCQLTWAELDLDAAELHLAQGKTGARSIPLAAPVVAALRAHRAEHPKEGDECIWPVSPTTMRNKVWARLQEACKAADVAPFSPHALRRAAVGALYRSGADPSVAASVAGHSPAMALKHYREVTDADRRAAVQAARLGLFQGEVGDLLEVDFAGRRK